MWRGWIIRSFFFALLLLCLGVWAWSYGHAFFVTRWWPSTGGYSVCWQVGVDRGNIHIFYDRDSSYDELSNWRLEKQLFGFSMQAVHVPTGLLVLDVNIPFWFPSILSGITLLFVWRQTKKLKPGGAFSVELQQNITVTPVSNTGKFSA